MIASDLGVNDKTTDIFPAQDKVDLSDPDWDEKTKVNLLIYHIKMQNFLHVVQWMMMETV